MPRKIAGRVPRTAVGALDTARGENAEKTTSYYRNLTERYGRQTDLQLDPDLLPWEKQPGETAKQYAYFRAYLEMAPYLRSLVGLAGIVQKDRNYLSILGRTNHWGERVLAYDTDQRRRYELRLEQYREELIKSHMRVSEAGMSVVLAKLATMDAASLSPRDLGPFVAAMGDIARKALGMDTQQGPRISVQAQAVSAAKADADAKSAGQQEARAVMEDVLASMERLAESMTDDQRAEGLEAWRASVLATSSTIDGEVVD